MSKISDGVKGPASGYAVEKCGMNGCAKFFDYRANKADCLIANCTTNSRNAFLMPDAPEGQPLPKHFSQSEWEALLQASIEDIRALSTVKGGEYAGDLDRLANFRRNGERLGLPMETVWAVYAGKHWDSISQYIMDLQHGKTRPRAEPMAGRVDDMLVYLLLFKAMLKERGQA